MAAAGRDAWVTFFFCFATGGLIFADTLRYPEVQGQGFGQGPAFYPQLLAWVLFLLGGLTLLQGLRSGRHEAPRGEGTAGKDGITYVPVILIYAVSVVLIALMGYTGFIAGGFLLTFLSVVIIKGSWRVRYLLEGLAFSFGMMVLIYLVFEVFVGIQLPEGNIFG